MRFYQKENLLCFPREELFHLFEVSKKRELLEEMTKLGFTFEDLRNDYSKMEQIADAVGDRGARDRDEHEIFAALYVFLRFYEPDSEVCFEVRGFDPNRDKISTLNDLNIFRRSVGNSDFAIKSGDGLRKFQLKRYRGEPNIEGLFKFIKDKLNHYGSDLGDTNLLIQIQSPPWTSWDIDFHELHDRMKSLKLKFPGEILISYNQSDKEHVIIQVYPELGKTRIPIKYPSTR